MGELRQAGARHDKLNWIDNLQTHPSTQDPEVAMKKAIAATACLAVLALLAIPVAAHAGGSWSGWITDEACGAKGNSADHKNCAVKCAEKGSPLVFLNSADKKIYHLDKQDLAKKFAGDEVTLTGTASGDKIAVDQITHVTAAPAKGH